MNIPQKLIPFISSACMSGAMAFIVSGTLTAVNRGLSAQFLSQWMHAFGIAYCVAFPTAVLVAPVVRKFIARLTPSHARHGRLARGSLSLHPVVLAFLSAALFGAATPASKGLLTDLSPFQLAGLLYLGAALGVAPMAGLRRVWRLPGVSIRSIAGVCGGRW